MSPAPADRQITAQIASNVDAIGPVCEQVRALLIKHGLPQRLFQVELVARECLNNAVLHGNRQDPAKAANLQLSIGRKWIRLSVADEGPGFNWRAKRRAPVSTDASSGRGMAILQLYCHRVAYNSKGNQVTVWMNKDKSKVNPHE